MNIFKFLGLSPEDSVLEALSSNDIDNINTELKNKGLPPLFFDFTWGRDFLTIHSQYRVATMPRFVISWFSVKVTEIYFEFLSNPTEEGYRGALELLGYDTQNWVDGTYPNQVHLEFTYNVESKKLSYKRL